MLWMRTAAMTALFLLAIGNSANAQSPVCPTTGIRAGGAFCVPGYNGRDRGGQNEFFAREPRGGQPAKSPVVEPTKPSDPVVDDGSDGDTGEVDTGHSHWTGKPGSHLHLGRDHHDRHGKSHDRRKGGHGRDFGKDRDHGDRHGKGGKDRGFGKDRDHGDRHGKGGKDRGGFGKDRDHGGKDGKGKGGQSKGGQSKGGQSKGGKGGPGGPGGRPGGNV